MELAASEYPALILIDILMLNPLKQKLGTGIKP
jgi:hypothetical protein